jgi:AraC-like DNA-binding protein
LHSPANGVPDLKKEPIVVIAADECRAFYETLIIAGEQVQVHAFEETDVISKGYCVEILILDSGAAAEKGLKLLRRIKQYCSSVPVIFLTDASSEAVAIAAFKAGAREYFKKPVSVPELQETIIKLLRLRRGTAEIRSSLQVQQPEGVVDTDLALQTGLPEQLLRAVHYLNVNLAAEIYLEKLAREAGMSKYHFCRVFKGYLGMSPMQFLATRRIERAKLLLVKPGITVTSVALRVGFNDISDFIRQFKKLTGVTPTTFKESLL